MVIESAKIGLVRLFTIAWLSLPLQGRLAMPANRCAWRYAKCGEVNQYNMVHDHRESERYARSTGRLDLIFVSFVMIYIQLTLWQQYFREKVVSTRIMKVTTTNLEDVSLRQNGSDEPKPVIRIDWPDAAKGVGIVLVVAGHMLGGLIDSDVPITGWPLREIFVAIYTFHMPLFFILSGLFVAKRIERDPVGFVQGIIRNIYYPYLLWSVIQFTLIYFIGQWANTPPGPYLATIVRIPFSPLSQFWFLLILAIMHAGTYVLLPRVGAITLVLIGLVMRSLSAIFIPNAVPQMLLDFFFYYALGVLLGPVGVLDVIRPKLHGRAVLGVISALGLLVMTVQVIIAQSTEAVFYQDHPRLAAALLGRIGWSHLGLGAALAMTAVVIIMAESARGSIRVALLYLGRYSLPIYILHVMFVAGSRIILVKIFSVTSIAVLVPVLLIAGIAGPLAAQMILLRLRLARPLGLA